MDVHKSISTPRKEVFIKVTFLKIGEIDTVKECFTADALIESKWREQSLDGRTDLNLTEILVDKYWNPKLYVDNTVGEPKETISQTLHLNSRQEAFLINQKRIKGVFFENLELHEFPFDTQDITLTVVSEHTVKEVELFQDPEDSSSINVSSFVDEQEWQLCNHVDVSNSTMNKIYGGSAGIQHPAMLFKCRAARRYGYFMWNLVFVMVFIGAVSFTIFSVPYNLGPNRLQLTFILLLTTVAFRSNVNNSLPKISYLTYLDKYMLGSWALQCLICIWHAIVGAAFPPNDTGGYWADKAVLIVTAVLYVLLQACFALFLYLRIARRKQEFQKKQQSEGYNDQSKQEVTSTSSLVLDSKRSKEKRESTPLRGVTNQGATSYSSVVVESSQRFTTIEEPEDRNRNQWS